MSAKRLGRKSFTLVDLLGLTAIAVFLLALGLPTLSRARELSKRAACSVNLRGIGVSARIYAAAHNGQWMVPPFKQSAIDEEGIDYLPSSYGFYGYPYSDPGAAGWIRDQETYSETPTYPAAGSTEISVTRAYWMLVRSGDVRVQHFICPSHLSDFADPTEQLDLYYDFTRYDSISYGYQVPFGPPDTRPREGADPRLILAADKGPYYTPGYDPSPLNLGDPPPLDLEDSPRLWRPLNSTNHGGRRNGDGQSVLFADGHTSFARIPAAGIDADNVYTLITNEWSKSPYNRIHGDNPHVSAAQNPYPGQGAFGAGPGMYSTTDSLIWP